VKAASLQPYFRYAGLGVVKLAHNNFRFTQQMVSELRQLNYVDQWKLSRSNSWCHVMLDDLSYFSFSDLAGKPSYGYYPCPLEIESLADYLRERDIEPTKRNKMEAAEEYDLAIETATLKESLTPIRYDIDTNAYRVCVHPTAHLHIGRDNQIRIATRRIMTPLAFVLFVIRQTYPENWTKLLTYSDSLKLARKIRSGLPEIKEPNWTEKDEIQSYLY
jgi:hypothetical protein